MNHELIGVWVMYALTIALAIPLGKSIASWLKGGTSVFNLLAPLENLIYSICGIHPKEEMTWKQHLKALLTINLVWFVYGFVMLLNQGSLVGNPDGNANQSPDLAFNTVISFIVNCNLQHYSGETGLTYFTQVFVVAFFQFVSAGAGIASLFIVFRALRNQVTDKLGNFWVYFVQAITRILLPLSIVLAIILACSGTPTSWEGKDHFVTLQGDSAQVSRGPAAAMIAIKQVGTNGGGYFGVNSAHPLENPSYLTNIAETVAILLVPVALLFAFGFYLERKKMANVIFAVMTTGFVILCSISIYFEMKGNPAIDRLGITQSGSMEGKETRFGAAASAFWGIATTATSNGSVNAMHDSMMPMSGFAQITDMMVNAFYGGVGVGMLNYFIFLIIAVFISGLMVGRTPEFLGRKIEAREMKIAALVAILHPFIILAGAALSSYVVVHHPEAGWAVKPGNWLNNPGFHGFSEMLYEYTSSAANNGSGFEGLGDNNIFWNVSTGFVLILGRYLPIIGPVAIAGLLASKKYTPESAGSLKSDSYTFGIMTFAVIFIIAALSFFPALALGPLAEYFSM